MFSPLASSIPIFWGHGDADKQVDHSFSRGCAEKLASELGVPFISATDRLGAEILQDKKGLRFHTYPNMPHWFGLEEFEDIVVWLGSLLQQNL